ncbi:hypothetical protein BD770DRAFT_402882, partial [Pilaira anomala]
RVYIKSTFMGICYEGILIYILTGYIMYNRVYYIYIFTGYLVPFFLSQKKTTIRKSKIRLELWV